MSDPIIQPTQCSVFKNAVGDDSYPIYLDNSATTPVDPRVAEKMIPYLCTHFGNAASNTHVYGWQAEKAVEEARGHVAALVGADAQEIVWTSGATEANNLALKGAAHFYQKKGKHLITVQTEHKSVLDSCRELERQGFEVSYLEPQENGLITIEQLEAAIRPDTVMVSVMLVNNEIGVIQPLKAIAKLCRSKGVLIHSDAAQACGKMLVDVQNLDLDMMTMTAHKINGPKGIGALYVRRRPRIRLEAQMHGGGHERGMRSGTLATHQIVGMGEAYRIAKVEMEEEIVRIRTMRDRMVRELSKIEASYINGDMEHRVAHNLNISFNYVEGEAMMMAMKGIAVSSGSACTSASLEPSYVLRAIGRSDELAHSSLRITLGRFTTNEEVDFAIKLITEKVAKLRGLSPLWEMYKEGVDMDSIQWAGH